MLRKVKGQHKRFTSRIFDFHTAIGKCGLSDESNLGIDLAENHILMISNFEFSNAAASSVGMEQRGTLRAKSGLTARLNGES